MIKDKAEWWEMNGENEMSDCPCLQYHEESKAFL